ncbi:hypothetical protein [Planomonospora venezuelensis]|uniref:Uncharacterized protein n=1 Tax=Planomonospora venezuelensis TaxID=1999 RepID=A0A841DBL7_PLAVE|nr:hypothetical protein [Planomonospora venezuelensis]MBB5966157.1 hypothetical protein [Planomonospora venezuelensis]GIN05812.1 hypothetical protein Pve01_74700 [Planomonospora venezuelensis]
MSMSMEPYQFFTDAPTATDRDTVMKWFRRRKVQVAALDDNYTPKSGFDRDAMSALRNKLNSCENGIATDRLTPADAVTGFQKWLADGSDHGAWDAYVADQTAKDTTERKRQEEAAALKRVSDAKEAARRTAMNICGRHSGGLLSNRPGDNPVGRVVCGLAVIGSPGVTFEGYSGQDMHQHPTSDLIRQLVRGITQSEKWPPEACAEVDALKRWLNSPGVNVASIEQIPRDTLVFHARVWHPGGRWGGKQTSPGWQDRGACVYCQNWIGRIGAISA